MISVALSCKCSSLNGQGTVWKWQLVVATCYVEAPSSKTILTICLTGLTHEINGSRTLNPSTTLLISRLHETTSVTYLMHRFCQVVFELTLFKHLLLGINPFTSSIFSLTLNGYNSEKSDCHV